MRRQRRDMRRTGVGAGLLAATLLVAAACGAGDSDPGGTVDEGDIDDALEDGGELLVWGWGNAIEPMIEEFMAEHPQVSIEFANVGAGPDHFTAVENAMAAGSGAPDVIVMQDLALPQFVLNGTLANLSDFGADQHADTFIPGAWAGSQFDDSVHMLPMSSGPAALYYNEAVFEEIDLDVPTTWEEYVETARAFDPQETGVYIANDAGDPVLTQGMLRQQGGVPFQVDGENVSIDLAIPEVTNYTDLMQPLIDEDLISPIASWSDEWYQALGNGTIATLVSGAWMAGNFESGVEQAEGDWRVAPLPQWEEGAEASFDFGASGLSVVQTSENPELGYAFVEWATAGPGVDVRLYDTYHATVEHIESEGFLTHESEYFGGQPINEVYAESAAGILDTWQHLPYQVYADTIFNDHFGAAYTSNLPLSEAFSNWQEALVTYGQDQGFTVNDGGAR